MLNPLLLWQILNLLPAQIGLRMSLEKRVDGTPRGSNETRFAAGTTANFGPDNIPRRTRNNG
jgi:hypothetical protein